MGAGGARNPKRAPSLADGDHTASTRAPRGADALPVSPVRGGAPRVPRCDSATAYGPTPHCSARIRPTPDCGARIRPKEQRHSGCSESDSRADGRTSRHAAIFAAGPRGARKTARGDVHARGRGAGADGRTRRSARRLGGTTGQDGISRHRARPRRLGVGCRGAVPHQRSPLALGTPSGSGALQSGKCGTTCSSPERRPRARGEHSTRCRLRLEGDGPSGRRGSAPWASLRQRRCSSSLRSDRELARADVMPMHRTQRVRPRGGFVGRPIPVVSRSTCERLAIGCGRGRADRGAACLLGLETRRSCDMRLACCAWVARAPGRARCLRLSLGSGVPSSSTNAHAPRHLAP